MYSVIVVYMFRKYSITIHLTARLYHCYSNSHNPRCRMCKDASETVQIIVAGCKMQAGTAYMESHNQVAGTMFRNICAEYGFGSPKIKLEDTSKGRTE